MATFPTHDALSPGDMARLVEERGFQALLFAEHTHIPASERPLTDNGQDLPRKYWHTYDLFVAMTAAAAATSRLRVGSAICLVIERDPIITAKEVASIDHLSGGRVDFGVGAGWNRQEMANHGTNPAVRMQVMAERVEAMKVIWAQDEASFHGQFVSFGPIWSWPKPAQRPHPPILVGGYGPRLSWTEFWPSETGGSPTSARPTSLTAPRNSAPRRTPDRGTRGKRARRPALSSSS